MEKKHEIKEGDFFRFHYTDKYREEAERRWYSGYLRHCFEGILHARVIGTELRLVDTYWGLSGDGQSFSEKEARERGTLEFIFNIADVEKIPEHERVYYSDDDLFSVSEQHACVPSCVFHFKRKGAEKSNKKMLAVVNEKIREQHKKVDYAIDELKRLAVKKEKIEGGDINIYL